MRDKKIEKIFKNLLTNPKTSDIIVNVIKRVRGLRSEKIIPYYGEDNTMTTIEYENAVKALQAIADEKGIRNLIIDDFLRTIYSNCKDDGIKGKASECCLNSVRTGRLYVRVKSQNKHDGYKTIVIDGKRYQVTIEYKTACGEITDCEKSDYIVYSPEVDTTTNGYDCFYVFTREQWKKFINGYPGRGQMLRYDRNGGYNIQSFRAPTRPNASRPLAEYIWSTCKNQPTFREWCAAVED